MQELRRLRRKAVEGGSQLLADFAADRTPFVDIIRAITGGQNELVLTSSEGAVEAETKVAGIVANLASCISLRIAVPILLETIGRFYFDKSVDCPAWMGMGLKVALAQLWRPGPLSNGSDSLKVVRALVTAASFSEILRGARLAFTLAGTGTFVFGSHDWRGEGPLGPAIEAFSESFASRGLGMRATTTAHELMRRPVEIVSGIEKVLGGAAPSSVPEFHDTLFAEVQANESLAFWEGLLERLLVLAALGKVDDPYKLAFIADANRAFGRLIWSNDWHARRSPWLLSRLISERPLVPVGERWVVASARIIADSLAWHIESWFFGYRVDSSERLSEKAKKLALTEPFERDVQKLFAHYGFRSGGVTDAGSWQPLNEKQVQLVHRAGEKSPGEIDVLAVHDRLHQVVLGECKVLALPVSDATFRNTLSKVGTEDSEAFYSKQRAKLEWLRGTSEFGGYHKDRFLKLVILDRPSPGLPLKDDAMAITVDDLRDFLAHVVGEAGTTSTAG